MKHTLPSAFAHFLPSLATAALVLLWPSFAQAQAFSVGDRVQANGGYTIRTSAAGASTGYLTVSGTQGTIVAGPTYAALSGVYYYWYDVNWNSGEDGWSIEASMTLLPPAAPVLVSPGSSSSPGPVLTSTSQTLSWNAASGATSYGVYVEDMGTLTFPYDNDNVGNVTSLPLPAGTLVSGHNYAWNCRANNSAGQTYATPQALYFQVQIPVPPPAPPVLVSPGSSSSPGPMLTSTSQTLSWNAASGATSYGVYVEDMGTLTFPYDNDNVGNVTSLALPAGTLVSGHSYAWNCRANNSAGYTYATPQALYFQVQTVSLPLGVDVSEFQGSIIWSQVSNPGGKEFAIIRATAGVNTTDSQFAQNAANARAEGLLVGAYHFAYPQSFTAQSEAQKFLSVASAYIGTGYLPPALDIEDSDSEDSYPYLMGRTALSQWIRDWCAAVKQATGATPMIYTTRWYANNYFDPSLNVYPFWVPTYSPTDTPPNSTPANLAPWSTWTFQQYEADPTTQGGGTGGTCPGISGYALLDSFNGDLAALQALANQVPAIGPSISAFNVTPQTATLGSSVTISYTVSDNGGSGLQQIQLWRANVNGSETDSSWTQIGATVPLSGNGPLSGTFNDTPAAAGEYWYGIHVNDNAGNYIDERVAGRGPIQVTITTPQPVTISWPNPTDITYGTALGEAQLNATATFSGTAVPGNLAYSPPAGTVLAAGNSQTLSVTFTPTDTTQYLPATATASINVLQAPLSVTASSQSKPYGAPLPALTVSYGGFVNGDTAASLTTPPTVTTSATATSAAGAYPVTASGAADANYTFSYVAGTLTVTPVGLTITANSQSKPYGAALAALTVSYSGFVNGDTAARLTTPPTVTTTATASSAAGAYPITASGAVDANYTISCVAGTLTVTPVGLTITANSQSKPYGAPLPALTVSYGGFVNGDTAANLTTPPTVTTTATASSVAGAYPITASGVVDANYTISYVAGTLTVTPVGLTITNPIFVGQTFSVSVSTVLGPNYTLEYKNSFTDPDWIAAEALPGTGAVITLTDNTATSPTRFYRIRVQ